MAVLLRPSQFSLVTNVLVREEDAFVESFAPVPVEAWRLSPPGASSLSGAELVVDVGSCSADADDDTPTTLWLVEEAPPDGLRRRAMAADSALPPLAVAAVPLGGGCAAVEGAPAVTVTGASDALLAELPCDLVRTLGALKAVGGLKRLARNGARD